jgi:hypothetical protein
MLTGSVIGLAASNFIFRKWLRDRGWLKVAASVAVAGAGCNHCHTVSLI